MYIAHLRIKKDGIDDGYHSVMVSDISYDYDANNNIIGIKFVNVANPWNGSSFTGKTSYAISEIARWDIFKISPTVTNTVPY